MTQPECGRAMGLPFSRHTWTVSYKVCRNQSGGLAESRNLLGRDTAWVETQRLQSLRLESGSSLGRTGREGGLGGRDKCLLGRCPLLLVREPCVFSVPQALATFHPYKTRNFPCRENGSSMARILAWPCLPAYCACAVLAGTGLHMCGQWIIIDSM